MKRYEIKQEARSSEYGQESGRRISTKEYRDELRIGFLGRVERVRAYYSRLL